MTFRWSGWSVSFPLNHQIQWQHPRPATFFDFKYFRFFVFSRDSNNYRSRWVVSKHFLLLFLIKFKNTSNDARYGERVMIMKYNIYLNLELTNCDVFDLRRHACVFFNSEFFVNKSYFLKRIWYGSTWYQRITTIVFACVNAFIRRTFPTTSANAVYLIFTFERYRVDRCNESLRQCVVCVCFFVFVNWRSGHVSAPVEQCCSPSDVLRENGLVSRPITQKLERKPKNSIRVALFRVLQDAL